MKNVRVARRYAKALMSVAEEQRTIDGTAKDLSFIETMVQGSHELRLLLASPVVSVRKKTAIFKEVFGPYVSTATLELVDLMTSKNREALLPVVIEQFNALRDEKMGIVTIDVRSAVEVTPLQEKDLMVKLEQYTNKKVRVRFALDKTIKGGLVVKIGDTVLDASVRRQLELLKERFVKGDALSN